MTQSSSGTDRAHTSSDATDLGSMRQTYGGDDDLVAEWLDGGWRPLALAWLDHAIGADIPEPNAMVLATVDGDGRPATRTVLCKSIDDDGVVFYTNYESDKGRHLAAHPYASATFPWIGIERQITFRGNVVRVDPQQTLEYWNSRPRGSQLGAWASEQSRPAADRAELDARLSDVTARFDGADVPVPANWGGLRIVASSVEFWQGRNNRMHNRIRYDVDSASVTRLQP